MKMSVIPFGDFHRQPAFEFHERHRRLLLARIPFALPRIGKRRSRQQMNSSHDRADQALDVAAKVRCRHRSEFKLDFVLLAAAAERRTAKITAIVGSEDLGQATEGPFNIA